MSALGATCPPGGVSVLHRAHLLLGATRPRKYRYPVADWLTRIEIPTGETSFFIYIAAFVLNSCEEKFFLGSTLFWYVERKFTKICFGPLSGINVMRICKKKKYICIFEICLVLKRKIFEMAIFKSIDLTYLFYRGFKNKKRNCLHPTFLKREFIHICASIESGTI